MKFDSPLFDGIRVKPDQNRRAKKELPPCEWPGCSHAGGHRAPKGRDQEHEYWNFCVNHAREYNQSYNFFKGMSESAVASYQKDALTGHRPTWKMGMNKPTSRARPKRGNGNEGLDDAADPFSVFSEMNGQRRWKPQAETKAKAETRMVYNAERKALRVMGLEASATLEDVKVRFKALVKQHHPDANGGDRSSEDRLREIIQAYNYLKSIR
jgi:curved DNA-binding protein CbpA